MKPVDWFEANRDRFFYTLEQIEAAKETWRTNYPGLGMGVYFLFDEEGLLYVGKSTQIAARIWRHKKERFDLTHFSAIWVPELFIDRVEVHYIQTFHPEANRARRL